MVAYARTQATPETADRVSGETGNDQAGGFARLALLYAEAEETARLANLLGRSFYTAIALPLLGLLTIGLAGSTGLARPLVWCAFVAAAAFAMLHTYFRTIGQPFERVALKSFATDMSAILLYAGFAWGAGAFLVLPAGTNMAAAILFAAAPGIAIAALLREREAVFLFLTPVAACVFRQRATAVRRRRACREPDPDRLRGRRRRGGVVGSPGRRFCPARHVAVDISTKYLCPTADARCPARRRRLELRRTLPAVHDF